MIVGSKNGHNWLTKDTIPTGEWVERSNMGVWRRNIQSENAGRKPIMKIEALQHQLKGQEMRNFRSEFCPDTLLTVIALTHVIRMGLKSELREYISYVFVGDVSPILTPE